MSSWVVDELMDMGSLLGTTSGASMFTVKGPLTKATIDSSSHVSH